MGVLALRYAVVAYMVVFLVVTTWPGVLLFNKVRPLVFGLPFNLFFIALIIVGALCLLVALYRSEQRSGEE
ncbi:uncharacterized protein DUF3311 [Eilatimonas milleporae]|uniref:Uncharacterized protein DUF3311 n=2 Tax=Eilatimonas milleporae TaxID=911205 RepID=A0A3M0CF54_9PROT|nr:uncharacterized protein DUF3311 [Eilatimonas milleporae]